MRRADPGVVMDEIGHTDPLRPSGRTWQAMRHDEDEKAKLRALVAGADLTLARTPEDTSIAG